MNISDEIITTLKECHIPVNDALPYLISLYYGYKPTYIPEKLEKQINASGIIKSGQGSEGINWVVPLFDGQNTHFDWVDRWVNLFKEINPERRGNARTAKAKMKKFFAKYPQFRKEDVVAATRMYFRSLDDPRYLMTAHYFIQKGVGVSATETLLEWCEKYERVKQHEKINSSDSTNTMRR